MFKLVITGLGKSHSKSVQPNTKTQTRATKRSHVANKVGCLDPPHFQTPDLVVVDFGLILWWPALAC
jgi:hypothetical protein